MSFAQGRAAMARRATSIAVLVLGAVLAVAPAQGVPPPPPRPATVIDLRPGGAVQTVEHEVRAYQPVPLKVDVVAGDTLLAWLSDDEPLLVLHVANPAGAMWLEGARPGPDGLTLRFAESGIHLVFVAMSADAARAGKATRFRLRLMLRR